MSNTIKLKNYLHIQEEMVAVAAITPGMLVEIDNAEEVQAHSTAGGNALPMFAVEDELQGKGIGDAYAADDQVQVWIPQRGDQVLAILKDGETAVIGSWLESDAAGALVVHVADAVDSSGDTATVLPLQIVGQALEAVDLSAGSSSDDGEKEDVLGTNKRIKIRIV